MKYRLERGGDSVALVRHGRVVTLEFGDGRTEDRGSFDERSAEEQLQVLVDEYLAEGWVESDAMRLDRERLRAEAAQREALDALSAALAAASDPRAALRAAAGRWFAEADAADVEALLALVVGVDDEGEGEVLVRLTTGGALRWHRSLEEPLTALWLYPTADALDDDDHAVYFGEDAGPPEPPEEVEGDVDWFVMTFSPNEKYWFTREQAPWAAHAWEHDGGLTEDGRSPEQVLSSVLLGALRSGAGA